MELLSDLFTWATSLIDSLTTLVSDSPWTYVLVFALVALDVVFPVLPAEAIVTTAAVIAGQGQLNIVWVMVAAGLGAFVGDNVAYWIGRAAGRPLVERLLRGDTSRLGTVERQFQRRGGTFVIVGRFVPGGRTVVAIGAGVVHFGWAQFLFYDAIAAVIWSFQAALPGYIGGIVIQDKPWLALIVGLALSAAVAGGLTFLQRWREGRHDDGGKGDGSDQGVALVGDPMAPQVSETGAAVAGGNDVLAGGNDVLPDADPLSKVEAHNA